MLVSHVRSYARVRLTTALFFHQDKASLKAVFDAYDTNHSGCLDAYELKLALRKALGAEMDLKDCVAILSGVDADGNGQIDFDEFQDVCHVRAPTPGASARRARRP